MQGQGLKLNTKAFVAHLVEDMRKTAQTEGMVLDMQVFACPKEDGCHICAPRFTGEQFYAQWVQA